MQQEFLVQFRGGRADVGATLAEIRAARRAGAIPAMERVTVRLPPGEHFLAQPLVLTAEDSHVTLTGVPGAPVPTLHAGIRLSGWRAGQFNHQPCLSIEVPWPRDDLPRLLLIRGRPRPRARWPKVHRPTEAETSTPGFARLDAALDVTFQDPLFTSGHRFILPAEAPLPQPDSAALPDAELVLVHFWVEERLPMENWEPQTRTVTTTRRTIFRPTDDYNHRWSQLYLEHLPAAFTEPGEWYFERASSTLHYLPLPGESAGDLDALLACGEQLIRLEGSADAPVRDVVFADLRLSVTHTGLPEVPPDPACRELAAHAARSDRPLAVSPQGAASVPAAVCAAYAHRCAWLDCQFGNLGGYGLHLAEGTRDCRVEHCVFSHLGAGGIHLCGGTLTDAPASHATGHIVAENILADGGFTHHSGIAIFVRHAAACRIERNHIRRFTYSGISLGWSWGFDPQVARDHLVTGNDIADIGLGWLSDLGGIYALGLQPGTVIRGNHVARVRARGYGGAGIYLDQGSAEMLVERNLVHDCSGIVFTVNYARDNRVVGNLFAFGHEGVISLNASRSPCAFTLEQNTLLVREGRPLLFAPHTSSLREARFRSDDNVIWSPDGSPIYGQNWEWWHAQRHAITWADWQSYGQDPHSEIRDPGLRDSLHGDFSPHP